MTDDLTRFFGHTSPGSMGDYPICDCGHSSPRHHGDDRSGNPIIRDTACKDCSWCDYYKPRPDRDPRWAARYPVRALDIPEETGQ